MPQEPCFFIAINLHDLLRLAPTVKQFLRKEGEDIAVVNGPIQIGYDEFGHVIAYEYRGR